MLFNRLHVAMVSDFYPRLLEQAILVPSKRVKPVHRQTSDLPLKRENHLHVGV